MARLRRLLGKLDELDAKLQGPPLEHRWERQGVASGFQRWSMRHPVLAPVTMFAVALVTVIALDGVLHVMEWSVTALTVGLVVLVLLGRVAYGLMSRAADRKQPGSTRGSATPTVRFALDGAGGLFSRRAVVWDNSDELARIRLRAGLRHLRGECVTRDAEYVCEAERGWPLGRRRVTLRRRSDGTIVAHAAQPRPWTRRVALRGGIEFPHGPKRYALRPARRGGATLRANGNPVGAFVPHPGSLRCDVTFPSILDGQAGLFLIAAAVACNYTTAKTSGRRKREPMGPFGEGARIAGAVGFAGAGTTAARAGGGGGEATSEAWQRGTTRPT